MPRRPAAPGRTIHVRHVLAPQSEEDLVAAVQALILRYQAAKHETERLHSELAANVREFQNNLRRSYRLDQQQGYRTAVELAPGQDEERPLGRRHHLGAERVGR